MTMRLTKKILKKVLNNKLEPRIKKPRQIMMLRKTIIMRTEKMTKKSMKMK